MKCRPGTVMKVWLTIRLRSALTTPPPKLGKAPNVNWGRVVLMKPKKQCRFLATWWWELLKHLHRLIVTILVWARPRTSGFYIITVERIKCTFWIYSCLLLERVTTVCWTDILRHSFLKLASKIRTAVFGMVTPKGKENVDFHNKTNIRFQHITAFVVDFTLWKTALMHSIFFIMNLPVYAFQMVWSLGPGILVATASIAKIKAGTFFIRNLDLKEYITRLAPS